MNDLYGREIEYLRLSLTNRCNLNCFYCDSNKSSVQEEITLLQIERLIFLLAKLGIKKVRLTGGEPLLREDICEIVKTIAKNSEIKDISLTTNGVLLQKYAKELKNAGLHRVNISLDSLNKDCFNKISRSVHLEDVKNGIDEAISAGLLPVKLNVVLMKSINDEEAKSFMDLAIEKDIEVRFIEYMPLSSGYDKTLLITEEELLSKFSFLKRQTENENGVARLYTIEGHKGKIGFISAVSKPFCESCNRLRVTSDCKLRFCLGDNKEVDLKEILAITDEEKARNALKELILLKPQKGFCGGFQTERGMKNIGG